MKLEEYIKKHGNVEIEEKQLNELLGIKEKVWKPSPNNLYYFHSDYGQLERTDWCDHNVNNWHWQVGNVFETKEEAEFALEKRKVEVELQRFADEYNECEIDWENARQIKYFIEFSYETNKLNIYYRYKIKNNSVYFTTREIAEQAIKAIGEDRLKKYYFGVEE